MGRNGLAMLAVLVIGAAILFVAYRQGIFGTGGASHYAEAPKDGNLYPLKVTGTTLAGNAFDSEQMHGKVLLVNIFATWCGPCINETPHLVNMYNELNESGLEMVMVTEELPEKVRPFAEFNHIPYAIIPNGGGIVAQVPGFQGYPTTIILDKTGKVRYQIVGAQVGRIRQAVTGLLNE